MALIEWTKELSVNFSTIDSQHKKLIGLINKLHDAMKEGKGSAVLDEVINEMSDYAKIHFETEEKYMEKFKFPELVAHREKH
ncbi:MAG: bacteriohemerythrin, partial [bacterium]|nr:bacteriohemerythrin [bacterium]